jgi:glyoxylase-like metal-dependent hydrolase (beta-lactamase superfamily II)
MTWEPLTNQIWQFSDSCVVYAFRAPTGWLVVNAGSGDAAGHFSELPESGDLPVSVVLTHHFRDHTDGARAFSAAGAEVWAPYWEQEYLLDPAQHFSERQTWNSYDNRWDRFSPVFPVPVDHWLMDYATHEIAGAKVKVVPAAGVTNGAVSLVVEIGEERIGFVGETIHSPGKIARIAPLQYNYNDFDGSRNLWFSCERLMEEKLDRLLPSLGTPMDDPTGALTALRTNMRALEGIHPGVSDGYDDPQEDDLEEFIPGRLYFSSNSICSTHFLISGSGRVLAIDYGYNSREYVSPQKQHLSNRRPTLHGMKGLEQRFGKTTVDAVLVSHFHDDHVNGIPMLQRLFGTEVLAAEHFSDILEHPARYDRPCLWHEPITVDRKLPCGEAVTWEDFTITLHPMSGHTRFATLICMEFDDVRLVHTGDQVFFRGDKASGLWLDKAFGPKARMFTNHVYKNGLDMGCYRDTAEHLKNFQPNWVITGHTKPYEVPEGWFEEITRGAAAFDDVHAAIMPLADDDVHFGPESQAAKLKPYRVRQDSAGPIEFEGWVINPFATARTAVLRVTGPDGWESDEVQLALEPRQQRDFNIVLRPAPGTVCRRQPVALELTVGDRPFGQVTEALVTIGCPRF